jgi:hypothetical protein
VLMFRSTTPSEPIDKDFFPLQNAVVQNGTEGMPNLPAQRAATSQIS